MVKCPRCGYENSFTAVYCDNCAYRLTESSGSLFNNQKRKSGWDIGIAKKIVIVLGIIIIALLLFSFVYNNTQPSHNETLNIITEDGSIKETSSYPDVAFIDYEGNWYAEMGNPNFLVKKSGYGSDQFNLDCASWDRICIDAYRYDGMGELKVQLLRNGEVVAENSTTNGSSRVVLNYNF